jgi:hypothetical protein
MKKTKNGYFVAMGSPGSWNDKCVGVKIETDKVKVIDTKQKDSPVLEFDHEEWKIFINGVKNNEFDLT